MFACKRVTWLKLDHGVAMSLQPAAIAAILGPIVNLIAGFKTLVASVFTMMCVGGIGNTIKTVCCANYLGRSSLAGSMLCLYSRRGRAQTFAT
jgi:hypothetical protein